MGDRIKGGLQVQLAQNRPFPFQAQFDCAAGEMLAVVGPSGSGKSTLLRAIAGLEVGRQLLQGWLGCADRVWFDSSRRFRVPTQQRRIGMLFQNYALFPHLSAQANVEAALGHLSRTARALRAREWLARVHMQGLESRLPSALSGGQQQRVALARALAADPDLLLLDEPFAAVDRVTREKLYRELAQLRSALKVPALLVTHDMDEAQLLADRICIFAQGQVLQIDPPAKLLAEPKSALVARLMGQHNLFRAEVIAQQEGGTLIEWRGIRLTARQQPLRQPGEPVNWMIPRSRILLFSPEPGRERENQVRGSIIDRVELGDMVALRVAVGRIDQPPLHLNVPAHVAERRHLRIGSELWLSLESEGIWLMSQTA